MRHHFRDKSRRADARRRHPAGRDREASHKADPPPCPDFLELDDEGDR